MTPWLLIRIGAGASQAGVRGMLAFWAGGAGTTGDAATSGQATPRYGGVGWKKGQFKRSWLPAEVSDWWEQYDRAIARTAKIRDERRREEAQRALEETARAIVDVDEAHAAPPQASADNFVLAYEALGRVAAARRTADAARAAGQAERASLAALKALTEVRAQLAAIEEENIAILLLMA